jgi:pimeloyl-ACP methyl ester carboxylesterase
MKGAERRPEDYRGLKPKVGVIYGEKSELFSSRTLDYMRELIPQQFPAVAVPEAQHHVFLDRPLEFIAALRGVLSTLNA